MRRLRAHSSASFCFPARSGPRVESVADACQKVSSNCETVTLFGPTVSTTGSPPAQPSVPAASAPASVREIPRLHLFISLLVLGKCSPTSDLDSTFRGRFRLHGRIPPLNFAWYAKIPPRQDPDARPILLHYHSGCPVRKRSLVRP